MASSGHGDESVARPGMILGRGRSALLSRKGEATPCVRWRTMRRSAQTHCQASDRRTADGRSKDGHARGAGTWQWVTIDRGDMAMYFANTGPKRGPYMAWDANAAIGVLESRDNHMPIGMAISEGSDGAGVTRWRLTVHGDKLPGLWVVIDCEFRPAQ